MSTIKRSASSCLFASLALFAASLILPAYHAYEDVPGLMAFILGPIGLFAGHFSWLANPLLLISWVSFSRAAYSSTLVSAILSLAFALSFLAHDSIPVGSSGNFSYTVLPGYYLWLTSILSAIIASILLLMRGQRAQNNGEETNVKWYHTGIPYVAFALLAGLPITFTFSPSIKNAVTFSYEFSKLCKAGEVVVLEKAVGVKGLALLPDKFPDLSEGYESKTIDLGLPLLNLGTLEFLERPAAEKSVVGKATYERITTDGKRIFAANLNRENTKFLYAPTNTLEAEFEVRPTTLTLPSGMGPGFGGNRVEIRRRLDNKLIAHAQYFYHVKNRQVETCPVGSTHSMFIFHFISDALNIKNPEVDFGPKK